MRYLSTAQICERLGGCNRHLVALLFKYRLLPMTIIGKRHCTTEDALNRFILWADGKDLTNETRIKFWADQKKRPG